MKLIKVAAAALNQTPMGWERNTKNILQTIDSAVSDGVGLLCLPEMAITGYGCEDQFHSLDLLQRASVTLRKIAKHTEIKNRVNKIAVAVGLPILHGGAVYNCVAMCANGVIQGIVPKQNLANDGIHYEHRWFKPWLHKDVRTVINVAGQNVTFGNIIFNIDDALVGFEICEDAWAPERTGIELARRNVDIILNPSASHFSFNKCESRRGIAIEGSRSLHVAYVYANLLGNEAGRIIYEGDRIIANAGQIIKDGHRFSPELLEVTSAIIDLDINRLARIKQGNFIPQRNYELEVPFSVKGFLKEDVAPNKTQEIQQVTKYEEFTNAVTLGLRDYMEKTHSNGFVVSLSGGADSAAAACLVKIMAERMSRPVNELLTCVYQATDNSSATTKLAARKLADSLGARYSEIDIDNIVKEYTSLAEDVLGDSLEWDIHDIALQNIQARARAPGIWMVTNVLGALLLSTSNRSEAAVGYATMDGDTCGGLSPLGGIDKAFLLRWLKWYQDKYNDRAMQYILRQQPTAELRPQDADQSDEDDLMPYSALDEIEELAIRDKKSPKEVYELLYHKYDKEKLADWVEKFFKLWSRNQWKRERYAPSFHLDDENLDPKTWCRFPIISNGFKDEIAEMRAYAYGKYDV